MKTEQETVRLAGGALRLCEADAFIADIVDVAILPDEWVAQDPQVEGKEP